MHGNGNFCIPGLLVFETNVEEMIIMIDTSNLYIVQKQFTLANYLS